MPEFNISVSQNIEKNYSIGLLPQRNNKNLFYKESSSRSNLKNFTLSSENRRIIRKTENFSYQKKPLDEFILDHSTQKQIHDWTKKMEWNLPTSSIKKIFTDHIFNYVYIWKNENNEIIAYSICYFSSNISHIAYVFYDPKYSHTNLPIRLVLQVIIDSKELNLQFCYLGRFSKETGFYKRTMPGFEYFENNNWIKYT